MEVRRRLYDTLLSEHLAKDRQMAFVSGPRQVGKTTSCRNHADHSLNWDNLDDRKQILAGPGRLTERLGLGQLSKRPSVALFDELHKHPRWKDLLKGFFDTCADQVRVLVAGSSRLDAHRRAGDSLMGRHFLYRMHPFSVAETLHQDLPDPERIVRPPRVPSQTEFESLWEHGGYPEPFLKRDGHFSLRWQELRREQLMREGARELVQVQYIGQMELLATLLDARSAGQIVYSNLAGHIRVSVDTIRRWVTMLGNLHQGFLLRPWFRNVSRSLRKEPKWFLRDWAGVEDQGARAETFIACHLLKAVEGWNDMGYGKFELAYLRDKGKREVDFLVVRDGSPWFLVEVKYSGKTLSDNLAHFQKQLGAPFAFQVVLDMDYVDADCFAKPRGPLVVPAKTLLSQLL